MESSYNDYDVISKYSNFAVTFQGLRVLPNLRLYYLGVQMLCLRVLADRIIYLEIAEKTAVFFRLFIL